MHFGLTEVIGRRLRAEPPAGGAYAGPVVVLIDSASASGSELMAGALRAMGRARLIGQTSCGCLLGVLGPLPLPGGGRLSFSEVDFELEGLPRIEGAGLQPDESVPATLADLQRGHDAALTAAEAWLQQAVRKMGADPTSLPTSRPTPLPTPRPAS
jgi:carboxyl-terminal processing protease